ncbi:dethiobiotin synthase [Candidatus Berkiella cookevillensis]|uniref:ATP-dependent dethiobiotin synthetase BioD n=1 Tax=Candidatus Berkiella cookevillensis TaxID=437022 RepID=A0A0Q9YPM6_9GAMM|nr:dethiobiotin synthase [Candidatus Berkiella cookevillensis]MCS5709624.1 dethiobiotin synthase [Candidatus Berkiella cookevillensis]
MTALFITGTSTDIGKTFVLQKLLSLDKKQLNCLDAIKPLISGWPEGEEIAHTDTAKILQAQGKTIHAENIQAISPWRYYSPVAPDLAQLKENRPFQMDALLHFCEDAILNAQKQNKRLLIEGVGGVMSPISQQHTVLDWIAAHALPVMMVTGTYLGSITHLLTALRSCEASKISVKYIVLNESEDSSVSVQDTKESIARYTPLPIYILRRDSVLAQRDLRALYTAVLS